MNINASSSTQHMHMQKMQGANGGQGKGGMRDIMQSLSPEDRNTLREQMNSLSQEDRQSMISQLKEVDSSSMSSAEYTKTLLDIVGKTSSEESTSSTSGFSTYA